MNLRHLAIFQKVGESAFYVARLNTGKLFDLLERFTGEMSSCARFNIAMIMACVPVMDCTQSVCLFRSYLEDGQTFHSPCTNILLSVVLIRS